MQELVKAYADLRSMPDYFEWSERMVEKSRHRERATTEIAIYMRAVDRCKGRSWMMPSFTKHLIGEYLDRTKFAKYGS